MKHVRSAALLVLMFALPSGSPRSGDSDERREFGRSKAEYGLNYNYFHANAPPGQCGCFMLNGGSATVVYNITSTWAGVADMTLGHASNVNNTGQNITIFDYLFGPRYTRRMSSRYVPYGQVMLGGAREDVNFEFTINRNAFAVLAGGGVTTRLIETGDLA